MVGEAAAREVAANQLPAHQVPAHQVPAHQVAGATPDPELPMLTVADLGIMRDVEVSAAGVTVTITPTYSGCPAMREISADISRRLEQAGYQHVTVKTELAPPWSSDWITAEGRRKLAAAGIAPPSAAPRREGPVPLTLGARPPAPACPQCRSPRTRRTAEFSATACKSLYRCDVCGEPFEGVKAL
ncbi:MAG TPA: 1,2-phenylacetyl-CoA epoxidase subunit PaaD [Trebonia sp.]|nr:1,2-phenylacetyl-CoA epoxidase subunit PaaD [Trebonia sp.]